MGWSEAFLAAVNDEIEAAELATFGEYEAWESLEDAAEVYQRTRDGVKALPSPPAGVAEFVAWLDAQAKGEQYAANAGSVTGILSDAARGTADVVEKVPDQLGKIGGGLGAAAAGLALLFFLRR